MLKELFFNGLSLFQEYALRYVFPKTRARVRCKAQLKLLVEGFNECLERNMSSGIYNLINDFQRAGDMETEARRTVVDVNLEKATLLSEWYYNYRAGFDGRKIGDTENLLKEFSFIMGHTQKIFDSFARHLDSVALAKFKKISSGYPKFKQRYDNTLSDLEKLSTEAKRSMPEINAGYAFCLPEI